MRGAGDIGPHEIPGLFKGALSVNDGNSLLFGAQILSAGEPSGATQTALYYVYQEAFGLGAGGSTGLADAMSVILFAISIAVTISQLALLGRRSSGQAG